MNLRSAADEINGESAQIEWLRSDPEGIKMMKEYSDLEGGHAIWRESITKGFRQFCDVQGYEIKKFGE